MIISKLTTKAQTTIPQPIRAALHLNPGDAILYVIEGSQVHILKAPEQEQHDVHDNPFATFTEWNGEDDDDAYANL